MHNFFVENKSGDGQHYYITGADYNHIKNVLRMKTGDTFLVSCNGVSDLCCLMGLEGETAVAQILEPNFKDTKLPIDIYLFQGLPKADKMELIIQKTVELGVHSIIPVEMSRCVVKLEDKKKNSKVQRWQAIAESAAKQSKCNYIPAVIGVMSYKEALKKAGELDMLLVPYENKDGMKATSDALSCIKNGMKVGILIGPEGGFSDFELEAAVAAGGKAVSLGKRILRTETAAITSVAMCMLYTEIKGETE